jgi:hypothetical protein
VLYGLLIVCLGCAQGAGAAPHPSSDLAIRLGFDGAVKVGVPLPMDIDVPPLPAEGPARVVVETPALGPQTGVVVTSTVAPFDAVPGVVRDIHVPVMLSDIRRPVTVRVLVRGREILRRSIRIDPARVGGRVVAVLSRVPLALASLHRLPGRVIVASIGPEALPRAFQEYLGIDLLVLHDVDQERLDDGQRAAILTWVRLGGRLLVIPRPGAPAPAFLDPILPATVGPTRTVAALGPIASGGSILRPPAGPYVVSALAPRPGAETVRAGGMPIAVGAAAGMGYVTVWAVDPESPTFVSWPGGLRLWAAALGPPESPTIDVASAAERLPQDTPLDPIVHTEVGTAILLYVVALYLIRRRHRSTLGIVASVAVVCAGIGVFAALAQDARGRATVVTQATFLEQAPGAGIARAVTVAAVTVPYGGGFRIRAPGGAVAAPVGTTGDLEERIAGTDTLFIGHLRPGEGARTVYAVGETPLDVSGALSPRDRTLRLDLAADRLSRAEIVWGDRVYPLGTLPAGVSTRRLVSDGWKMLAELDRNARPGGRLFRDEPADAIVEARTPVLVGELAQSAPAFAPVGRGALGPHLTMLVVPLAR